MKETIKINLGQRLYDIEKDAYNRLKNYLDSLKSYFSKSPKEAEEILQDIEQRIADLLNEKISDKKQILNEDDVIEVIKKMGTVDDFDMESEISEEGPSNENQEGEKTKDPVDRENKRLFRDIENNILGGVCRGLASYFSVDVVWIRLVFVLLVLFKGAGILAYIILWFVVPAARTTVHKLQMHGRPINVENIEQSVKDEFKKVKENLNNVHKNQSFLQIQSVFGEIFQIIGSIILVILKVVLVIIGISFFIVGLFFVLGLLAITPFNHLPHISFENFPFWNYINDLTHDITLFTFALAIIILIPIIGILASSIRFIFNVKRKNSVLSAFSWTMWSLALVFVIVTFISGGQIVSLGRAIQSKSELNMSKHKTLYVSVNSETVPSYKVAHYNFFGKEVLHAYRNKECYIQPHFIISSSSDSLFYLEIGENSPFIFNHDVNEYNNHLYDWQLTDSILVLNKYFIVDDNKIWTIPGISVTIKVPKNGNVILKGEANNLFEILKNSEDTLASNEIHF